MLGAILGIMTAITAVKQYQAQERTYDIQQRQNELDARRSRVAAIREAQMKRAALVNEAASMGAQGGSAVSGGMTSLGSQLGSGLGYSSQYTNLSRDLNKASQQAEMFGALNKVAAWGYQNAKANPSNG